MRYSISNISTKVLATIAVFASLSVVCSAQHSKEAVRVKVPFSFETASGKELPAGTYTLHVEDEHIISIHGSSASCLALISVEQNGDLATAEHSKLVFERSGDSYFLREVWTQGQSFHSSLAHGKKEKNMERANNGAPNAVNVEVAALDNFR